MVPSSNYSFHCSLLSKSFQHINIYCKTWPVWCISLTFSQCIGSKTVDPSSWSNTIYFFWLTFGGAPRPSAWCTISEIMTSLFNQIPLAKEWDHNKRVHPQYRTASKARSLPNNILFTEKKNDAEYSNYRNSKNGFIHWQLYLNIFRRPP